MRSTAAIGLVAVAILAWTATGLGVEVSVELSTVNMAHVNTEIGAYADQHHESISGIHVAWGGAIQSGLGFSILGMEPTLGVRVLLAATESGGGTIGSSLLGVSIGGLYRFGAWSVRGDLNMYRGTFSFVRGGYDGLSGLGIGAAAAAGYAIRLGQKVQVRLEVGLQWLPVDEMTGADGVAHQGRSGEPFLDFTGVGVTVGVTW